MARSPEPGAVKTRMLPALSAEGAARLHSAMVMYICRRLMGFGPTQLWVSGDQRSPLFHQCIELGALGPFRQRGADLGERMAHIANLALRQHDKVILVGSDAPGIDRGYLEQARRALDSVDVVFGPAVDGGYVLLGLKRVVPGLFVEIPWGTGQVLERSLQALSESGNDWILLEPLPDIDRPEDLRHLPVDLVW